MRWILLLAAVTALALASPLAEAQRMSNLVLNIGSAPLDVTNEAQVRVEALLTFVGDASAYLNTNGIPVSYHVSRTPEWATVLVYPATDIIPMNGMPGVTVVASRTLSITVQGAGGDVSSGYETIEITATALPPSPLSVPPTPARSQFIVRHLVPEEPCHEEETLLLFAQAPPQAGGAASEDENAPLQKVQSSSRTAVAPSWAAPLAFAVVGALAGLVLLRRRTR